MPISADPGFVRSLGAGLAILDCFLASGRQAFAFGELKEASGLKHATFARALKLLGARGYLHRTAGGWRLGRRVIELGTHALDAEALRRRCRGALLALMHAAKVRCELHVRRAGGFILVEVHDPMHDPGLRFDIGVWRESRGESPVDRLLAAYEPEAPENLLRLRRQGWASGVIPTSARRAAVFRAAAPVLDATGSCLAAMAVAAPATGSDSARRAALVELVRHHAAAVSMTT